MTAYSIMFDNDSLKKPATREERKEMRLIDEFLRTHAVSIDQKEEKTEPVRISQNQNNKCSV